jgi:hypothetical protein
VIDVTNLDAEACRVEVLELMGWKHIRGQDGIFYYYRDGSIFEGSNPPLYPANLDGADQVIREAGWHWEREAYSWEANGEYNDEHAELYNCDRDTPGLHLWRIAVLVWRVKSGIIPVAPKG